MLKKRVFSSLIVLLTIFSVLSAQKISISGKVTNQSGTPIVGATVSLPSANLNTKTDSEGKYSLVGEISNIIRSDFSKRTSIFSLEKGIVKISLSKRENVQIELFDLKGNLLRLIEKKSLDEGNYNFSLRNYSIPYNIVIVCITIGKAKTNVLYMPMSTNGVSSHSATLHRNITYESQVAAIDTLVASAQSYRTKKVPISSYEGTVNITLEKEDVGNCTPSTRVNTNVSGSGPHKVVVETNSEAGINEGTIYRPEDIGPGKKYPIFVWGEGGCSKNGLSNSAAMAEIASHGYFVIADGTPNGSGSRSMNTSDIVSMGKPLLAYITWAIAQNSKPCSPYYQSLDTTKIATNGFSCGGLMATGTAGDKRITTWGHTSSGLFSANQAFYKTIHTPVLIVEGGPSDIAYENGLRDYQNISALGVPIMFFSKDLGHGGDLFSKNGGDFTKIILAWLNWWLKGDEGPTGKGALVGPGCKYCSDKSWEVKSANIP